MSKNIGFADFIRGTIAIKQYCNKYNYKFYLNRITHPIFNFLKNNEFYTNEYTYTRNVKEEFSFNNNHSYEKLDKKLDMTFKKNNNINITTHSFYRDINNNLINWGFLKKEDQLFIKTILSPSNHIMQKVFKIQKDIYNLYDEKYNTVHIRTGDDFLNNIEKNFKLNLLFIEEAIVSFIEKNSLPVILITDNADLGVCLSKKHTMIKYWNNNKTHIGNLSTINALKDTLVDYFIMSLSSNILCLSNYSWGSGFSESVSRIFNIPYRVTYIQPIKTTDN